MVILTTITRYKTHQLRPMVESLDNCGYSGTKAAIVYELEDDVINYLKSFGWKLYFRELNETLVVQRFKDYYEILKEYYNQYTDSVLLIDSRDTYFHKNPNDWILKNDYDFYIGRDGLYSLENHNWATIEMMKMYPNDYDSIKDKHHLNAGIMIGKIQYITPFLKKVYDYTLKSKLYDEKNPIKPTTSDQMAVNIITYQMFRLPEDESDLVINLGSTDWDGNKEYYIYHQYDRFENFWNTLDHNLKDILI